MSEHSHVQATGGRLMTDGRTPDGRPGLPEGLAQLIQKWRTTGERRRLESEQLEDIGEHERAGKMLALADMGLLCADELAAVCAAHLETQKEEETKKKD